MLTVEISPIKAYYTFELVKLTIGFRYTVEGNINALLDHII